MKKWNKTAFWLSLVFMIIGCSALSVSAVAENERWTLCGMNPWNGVEGVAFVISYVTHTGAGLSYFFAVGLALLVWLGLYVLLSRLLGMEKKR